MRQSQRFVTVTLTCDACATQVDARGLVGWWRLAEHPDGVQTRTYGVHPGYDLCSDACLATFAARQR